jgi:hypothetical protein
VSPDEAFECWAPAGGAWSGWVKPVLFAHLPRPLPYVPAGEPPNLDWLPPVAERVALVIDLPGPASVELGLAIAGRGYRPVPLFNACAPPLATDAAAPTEDPCVVDVTSILAGLVHGMDRLRESALPPDAPPAFLVDADRQAPRRPLTVGAFDNRSVVFATDFPSAALLAAREIRRAILVRANPGQPAADLAHALQPWQSSGIVLEHKVLSEAGPPVPYKLPRVGWLSGALLRFRSWLGMRRNPAGEFGEFIPAASGG